MIVTERQRSILELQAQGLSRKEIAENLGIKINTVKFHIKAIFLRLKVKNSSEAVARFSRAMK